MKPARIEFDLGQTRFGQRLRLILERGSDGREAWTLVQERANQRDETQRITLTDEQIRQMHEAIIEVPGRRT